MFHSLRWRITAIFAGFLLLVAASALATFGAIATQAADATVINLAGRQRMLSQRLIWLALSHADESTLASPLQLFDQTLRALRDGGATVDAANRPIELPAAPDATLRAQLDEAASTWSIFRAQLSSSSSAELSTVATRLLTQLEQIVRAFEARAQAKLAQLQLIQGIFLVSALALLAGGYFLLRRQLLTPLQRLERAARRMAQGDLRQPVPAERHDELGELAQVFDRLRIEIVAAHTELETRVDQRTQELTSAFEFSQEISAQIELDQLLQSVTDRARTLTRAVAASLCTVDRDPTVLTLIAASGAGPTLIDLRQALARDPAQQVVNAGQTVTVEASCANCAFLNAHAPSRCAVAPLRAGTTTLGALCVVRPDPEPFDANEARALTLLANSAAGAISNARLVEQQTQQAQQAAIAAERDRLAAELHDNVAQTLSFLNLKSDRLRELIELRQDGEATTELAQVKRAIDAAYRQVRTALTGLREPASNADDLRTRLTACVDEVLAASDLTVELNIVDEAALALPRVMQTQAYHIVREALSNTRRHAQARRVGVIVERQQDMACFTVQDDGRGFNLDEVDVQQHLGLNIMRTRAARCGGSLDVEAKAGQGTIIRAQLPLLKPSEADAI